MSTDLVKTEAQQLDAYIRNAEKLAGASLLPAQYQRQPANILLAIQTGAPLGFTAMHSLIESVLAHKGASPRELVELGEYLARLEAAEDVVRELRHDAERVHNEAVGEGL